MILNESAIKIQKHIRGHLEKTNLIRVLEFKYNKDMRDPALIL
jgi:hypothetical protein